MPWRECSVMDERLQFVARRVAGEQMADLCREFGISRKTGYKIFDRYQECGVRGLTDRSRRPRHYAHKLPLSRELHPERQARAQHLGCTKDSRAPGFAWCRLHGNLRNFRSLKCPDVVPKFRTKKLNELEDTARRLRRLGESAGGECDSDQVSLPQRVSRGPARRTPI